MTQVSLEKATLPMEIIVCRYVEGRKIDILCAVERLQSVKPEGLFIMNSEGAKVDSLTTFLLTMVWMVSGFALF